MLTKTEVAFATLEFLNVLMIAWFDKQNLRTSALFDKKRLVHVPQSASKSPCVQYVTSKLF